MKIPVEKSIYRKVYLQLRTGFLTERPVFYDAIRMNPPPVFTRSTEKLPNLAGLEDRLMKQFQRKYPYHFEDFVSDHSESTRYVAYNFAKKQAALMYRGVSEKKAFEKVEKEFLAEMDAINSRLFTKKDEKEESLDKKLNEREQIAYKYMHPDAMLHNALIKELNQQQRLKIHRVVDRTIEDYKRQYGDHIIEEKLKALEHYRLDKPHVDDTIVPVTASSTATETAAETAVETEESKAEAEGTTRVVAKGIDGNSSEKSTEVSI